MRSSRLDVYVCNVQSSFFPNRKQFRLHWLRAASLAEHLGPSLPSTKDIIQVNHSSESPVIGRLAPKRKAFIDLSLSASHVEGLLASDGQTD